MTPESEEDKARVVEEHNQMIYSWNQLGQAVHYQKVNDLVPPHPPASLMLFILGLEDSGFFDDMPEDTDLKRNAMANVVIGVFRWAQVCARNGLWFDGLLPCKCAHLSTEDMNEIYKFMERGL